MRKRIFLYYMILIVIGISVTGFFTSQLTQKFYKREVEQRLISSASLIENQISRDISNGSTIDYDSAAKDFSALLTASSQTGSSDEKVKIRVTFITYEGIVIGESETDFHEMENHSTRKEVQEALQGKTGSDIRFSSTLKMNFLYIAVPVEISKVVLRLSIPLVHLKNIDEIIWSYVLIGVIAGLILTSLLALKFSSSLTKPIGEIITASREISKGNYARRVETKSWDELLELSDTFNDMASKLEKTVEDLKDKNEKFDAIMNSMTNALVAVDTSYRIVFINSIACEMFGIKNESDVIGINMIELLRNSQINAFLKETVESDTSLMNEVTIGIPDEKVLRVYTNPIKSRDSENTNSGGILSIHDITGIKKLEQIRTDFVSNVTHELKTPLTSIRGFIETLRGGAINDPNVAEKFLEIIDIEAERLYMLINDILQLSEIESKQKDTNIHSYNLKSIIEEVLPILQGAADKKKVTLTDSSEGNIRIIANRNRIKQMLINLIDNAIKYNVEGGSVDINAYKAQGKVVITVKDTGIGIAPEHLPRIFERFYRVDKGRSRSMGGTGLGLSIVKHIVNLYNGDVRVNSEPGTGTEFIIQLPVRVNGDGSF